MNQKISNKLKLHFAGLIKSQFHQSLVIKMEIIHHNTFSDYHFTVKGQILDNALMHLLM